MAHSAQARQALSSLSGFPEWLPAGRVVEQQFIDILRRTFELHGFSGIQTRAVEPLTELTRKGETSKEVYLLSRLQGGPGEAGEADPAKQLGLHFDLTVPFARYVIDNAGILHFPFKRYQIQKVWRGERPQEGRFREFYQVDIDVVGDGSLPLHYDVEVPLIMHEALSALPIPAITIHVSNRKVAQGFYQSVGIEDDRLVEVLRVVDKLDKIGTDAVAVELVETVGITRAQAEAALGLATMTGTDPRSAARPRPGRPGWSRAQCAPVGGPGRVGIAAAGRCPSSSGRHRGRPEDRSRFGLLHRHRLRVVHGRARGPRLGVLRRPL